jgi:hypothetical protein
LTTSEHRIFRVVSRHSALLSAPSQSGLAEVFRWWDSSGSPLPSSGSPRAVGTPWHRAVPRLSWRSSAGPRSIVATSSRHRTLIRSMPLRLAPVVLAAFLSIPCASLAAERVTYTGRASVIDGDTVEIHGKRIRLYGIDAVESGQRCQKEGRPWRCGRDSAFALADKIGQRPITCYGDEFDRYRRLIARARSMARI